MTTSVAADLSHDGTSRFLGGTDKLHYHRSGDGPGLLLIHGSGPGVSGWANFGANMPVFAKQFTTVVPDMPGFGASYRPELPVAYIQLAAETLLEVMDAEGIDQFDVVGNSLGGAVAVQLTLDHPDRVRRLVLMGPGGLSPASFTPLPTEGIRLLVEFCEDPSRDRLVRWMQAMVGDQSFLTEERIEERWNQANQAGALDFIRDFFRMAMAPPPPGAQAGTPVWARLGEIQQPTLLTYGRDDRVTPLDGALHPMRNMPNAELHVFPNCGHWAMQEKQMDFERLVLDFLTRPTT